MKLQYLILFLIFLLAGLVCCKKDNNSAPVNVKWHATTMRRYNQDLTTGAISGDTTYQQDTFGDFDYLQFRSNSALVLSETGWIRNSQQQLTKVQDIADFTYTKAGTGFTLTRVNTNPGLMSGVFTTYAISGISGNTLTLHEVAGYINPSVPFKSIIDLNYTK